MRRTLVAPTLLALGLMVATGTAQAQPIGDAQRIFQGIEHFDPDDNFVLTDARVNDAPIAVQSEAHFVCITCAGPHYGDLIINWFRADYDAGKYAVLDATIRQDLPFKMLYVAGQAEMTGPAPDRIVKAFGEAVGEPVVLVEPYCCGLPNPTVPPG
jgi:hypothetical protein